MSPIVPYCAQEFSFKVQVPGGGGGKDDMITIGKAEIDMADYVDDQLCVQVWTFCVGGGGEVIVGMDG